VRKYQKKTFISNSEKRRSGKSALRVIVVFLALLHVAQIGAFGQAVDFVNSGNWGAMPGMRGWRAAEKTVIKATATLPKAVAKTRAWRKGPHVGPNH
jgi:hypothetical protein